MREVNLLQGAKRAARASVLERRDGLSLDQRVADSSAVRHRLAAHPAVRDARTLLAFASFGSEIDLDPLLRERIAAGVGVFLPYIATMSPPRLEMVRVTDLRRDLTPGRWGIREPDPAGRRPARVDRLDVVIAPGVAFDARRHRLGYGGGFYDRLLPRLRPGTLVIGVCFDVQLVDEVPIEATDIAVDLVITPSRTIEPGA